MLTSTWCVDRARAWGIVHGEEVGLEQSHLVGVGLCNAGIYMLVTAW